MAHIQDRWETVVDGRRVRTDRHGQGSRWRARYLDPDGAERSKTFDRKQDAERFLANITADVLRGAYVDPDAGRVTFSDFAEQWLEAQTFSEGTREATELRIRLHGTPTLGRHELRGIKPSAIQAWLRGLQKDLAPTYVRVILTNVSAVFNAAVDDGLIARNPCKANSVRPPKLDQRKVQPWSVEQVRSVIDALPSRYRAMAVVAAGCGLRQGEVFGLRVCDVDFLRKQLRVDQQVKLVRGRLVIDKPKGGRTRAVPLPEWVAKELARHLSRFPTGHDDLVFTSRETKPLNRNHINRYIWRPALAASGVDPGRGNGMHALRHFYASALIDAGESASAVAEYLGHADPGFTLRVYAHLFPSSEDRTRRAIDDLFEPDGDRQSAEKTATSAGTAPVSDGPQTARAGRRPV